MKFSDESHADSTHGRNFPSMRRNGYFHRWMLISAIAHALLFASFFRIVRTDADEQLPRTVKETMAADSMVDTHALFMQAENVKAADSNSATQAYTPESAGVAETGTDRYSAIFPETRDAREDWFADSAGRLPNPGDFLAEQYQSPLNDTLAAGAEALRRALLDRLMKEVARDSASPLSLGFDWERLIDELAERLRSLSGDSLSNLSTMSSADMARLARFLREKQLEQLWKQAVLFSMRDVAWARLEKAIRDAVLKSAAMCRNGSSDGAREPGNGRARGLDMPSSGNGGFFLGMEPPDREAFESMLLSLLLARAGSGLGNLATLFPADELQRRLAEVARKAAFHAVGGDKAASDWAKSIGFERIMREAFGRRSVERMRAMQQADELLLTIGEALGGDITAQLSAMPSAQHLRRNPWYFHAWANNYWDLVYRMVMSPNMLMPNLDKYAQAAKAIRNRGLPSSARLQIDGALSSIAQKAEFFAPKRVYVSWFTDPAGSPHSTKIVPSPMPTHAWGGAVRRSAPIQIDGELAEWNGCRPYALRGQAQGMSSVPARLQGANYLMTQWDNTGLYCAYRINDARDNPRFLREFWATDALELFFDPQNAKDSIRIEGRSSQFWVWPRGCSSGCTGQSVFQDAYYYQPRLLKDGFIRFASKRSGYSYSVEAYVPASIVPAWYPLPGKVIGFNYSINDGELALIRWVTNLGRLESEHPNLWGDLLLMGTDAEVSVDPGRFLLPGQNLAVRIADQDMNMQSRARDVVWVVVRSRLTGDTFPVSLQETSEDSGIFTGTLGTIFGMRARVKDRLSVRPGDVVDLYYLDQYAGGGRKNVRLLRSVEVGRGVFTLAG